MPSVDVAVPCYNYAHYLPECIDSILSQRDVDVRILIIDDQSPDNTEEVGKALAAADPRVFYTRNSQNLGLVGSSNVGVIDWASADYTLLLSADDLLVPGALARAVTALEAHPEAPFLFAPAMLFSENEEVRGKFDDPQTANVDVIEGAELLRKFCDHGDGILTPTAVVRTSAQKQVGGYNPNVPFACDMEMWIRMAAIGPILHLDTVQGCYRWHASNMSTAFATDVGKYWRENVLALSEAAKVCADRLTELPQLLEDFRKKAGETLCYRGSVAALSGDKALADAHFASAVELYPEVRETPAWRAAKFKYALANPPGRLVLGLLGKKASYTPEEVKDIVSPEIHEVGRPWRWWEEVRTPA